MADELRTDSRKLEFIIDDEPFDLGVKVRVVGVGDTTGKVLEHLRRSPIKDVEVILANADDWDLRGPLADTKDHGSRVHDPSSVQQNPVSAPLDQIAPLLDGANRIVIVACLGDDTAGLARTVAASCKETNALTIAVVTTPIECREQLV